MAAIGVNPWNALVELIQGSLGSGEGLGFTLYYATDFIFTGLAVALAFQGGLFNIGAEGQAYVGGLGAALVCLHGGALPSLVLIPLAIVAAALFGGAWAYLPGVLQAKRGSHIRHHDDHVQLPGRDADGPICWRHLFRTAGRHAARERGLPPCRDRALGPSPSLAPRRASRRLRRR